MNNLISVILTVYNRENYLSRCIDSILAQKNVNFEIIIIDDGSTDSSPQICDEYASKYDNIRVIHEKNAGLSVARNTGLDNVKGDFVFFIDDDDYLPEDSLYTLMKLQIENDADLVLGNYSEYLDDGSYDKTFKIPEKYCNKLLTNRETCELLFYSEFTHVLVVNWGKLYRKKIWDGVRFPDEIIKSEDQFVLPSLIEACERIYFTDKVVYNQVFSSHSITRSKYGLKNLFHASGISEVIKYLLKKKYYDIAVFKFGVGTRSIIYFNCVLKDEDSQNEIRRLYKIYCGFAKELMPYVSMKNKLRFLLFRLSLKGYTIFQRKHSKRFAKRNFG
ncbi:glycosyltransferase family 2 protein [Butyrivibrio sp. AE3004]|uniref:glycosyltransferase family 2 protein n=1 Tax=Butyrivibrio sp. AE3004 TaxID=1506994 RepID=UPI00068FAA4C|nr:glycosyltransferase [Butyrivibrio sp. AE3004]